MRSIAIVLSVFLSLTACSTLPTEFDRNPSTAFGRPFDTDLGRLFSADTESNQPKSGFLVLDQGKDAFTHLSMLADAAERSIDAQYYIWNSDTTGKLMAERLLRAAERGVRVRVLLDDFSVGDRDPQILALNAHPNIEVRLFNPFSEDARTGPQKWLSFFFDFGRLNRRMHNKTFAVDGSVAVVGGRNIGDEYFDAGRSLNFRDRDLLAVGPVVKQVSAGFDAFWNSRWAYPVEVVSDRNLPPDEVSALHAALLDYGSEPPKLPYSSPPRKTEDLHRRFLHLIEALIWADVEFIYDWPINADTDFRLTPEDRVAWRLKELIEDSRQDVLVESAYFVPGDLLLKEIVEQRTEGVRWRVLTNSMASNDVLLNHAGYARRRKAIVETGAELYEFRPDAASCRHLVDQELCQGEGVFGLHSKSAVFDRRIVIVGSFNMNMRSAFLNTETVLIVHSPELAQQVADSIEENLKTENSWRVTSDARGRLQWLTGDDVEAVRDPKTSAGTRMKSGFIELFPLERYY